MKELFKYLFLGIFIYFISIINVNAKTFYEGEFISGEYINKVVDGKTYYMTMQYIKDSDGNIVYCLEPFVTFENGKSYTEFTGDLTNYKNLTTNQKRRISLIIYYGYGYDNRTSSKWYVVTQYLVWKEVYSNANIYFTSTLNGNKINKYINEQEEILSDVLEHEKIPSFIKEYSVNYKDDLSINGFDSNYEIVSSDYNYKIDKNVLNLSDIESNGKISIRRKSNYYQGNVTIYDSSNSQDVIKPGNVLNSIYDININVYKGDITLDIRDDDSIYTVESDFSDTCYEILREDEFVSSVCTSDEPLIYKSDYLPYGTYTIRQISVGVGYVFDTNIYEVTISHENVNASIILYNKLLRNKIEIKKYACIEDECSYESDALFEIYDKNNNLVDSISTNTEGYSYITLGYGKYDVRQVSGLKGYSLADEFNVYIVDENPLLENVLYNYLIEDAEVLGEYLEFPDTGVDNENIFYKLFKSILNFFEEIFAFFE